MRRGRLEDGVLVWGDGVDEIEAAMIRRLGMDLVVVVGHDLVLTGGSCREGEKRREDEDEEDSDDAMVRNEEEKPTGAV